jgi:hypothetical protein
MVLESPTRGASSSATHGGIGVDERPLGGGEMVLDQERALAHLPQGDTPAELG